MFQQVGNRKPLSLQVEEELTAAIRSGKFSAGQKIPTENELCEIFKVSRTTIREAVKKMSARGIIVIKKGSGAYVSEISVKNASETLNMFFELSSDQSMIPETIKTRQIIEPVLAGQAALLRTDEHIRLLEQNIIDTQKCPLEDKKKEADLDNDFHRVLLSITNNKVLSLLISPIFSLMPRFKTEVFAKSTEGNLLEVKNKMLTHHQNILAAIIAQDKNQASLAMKAHLAETLSNYRYSFEE